MVMEALCSTLVVPNLDPVCPSMLPVSIQFHGRNTWFILEYVGIWDLFPEVCDCLTMNCHPQKDSCVKV